MKQFSNRLTKDQAGIWKAKEDSTVSYPDDGHGICFQLEDNSFWFRHRNSCIISLVKKFPPLNKGIIFDVGGGNGFVSLALEKSGFNVALVEPGITGALNAKKRGVSNVICASTDTAAFMPNSMPAIGLFDVLEHIENDSLFLDSVSKLLLPGGMLYITVPALSLLWSEEDEHAGHFRRYSLSGIKELIENSGFSILFASYMFSCLTLPIFLFRSLPYRLKISKKRNLSDYNKEHGVDDSIISKIIYKQLNKELTRFANNRSLLYGSSCILAARVNPISNG